MIDIYQIDDLGQWTGAIDQIAEAAGCDTVWMRASAPPEIPEGGAVVWAGGRWFARSVRLDLTTVSDPPGGPEA